MEELNFPEHIKNGKYRVCELSEYIEADQARCFGKPTFKGTRVPVHLVFESLAEPGQTVESIATDYLLSVESVRDAIFLAARIFRDILRLPMPSVNLTEILREAGIVDEAVQKVIEVEREQAYP
jgi:uncharacterized protein (DUF433 family)